MKKTLVGLGDNMAYHKKKKKKRTTNLQPTECKALVPHLRRIKKKKYKNFEYLF